MQRVYLATDFNSTTENRLFQSSVDDWNEQAYQQELYERVHCDWVLYWITPEMTGVYSIAEAVDDSNKRPAKVIFGYFICDENKLFNEGQIKSLRAVAKMIEANGGNVCSSLEEVADLVNHEDKFTK